MCDLATRNLMEHILDERCWRGEMFTAFDITREARRRGCTERHRHLKMVVHEAFVSGLMGPEYRRVLIEIAGADQPAWLYFHKADDPADYRPLDRTLFGPPSHLPERTSRPIAAQPRRRSTARPRRRTVFSLLSFFASCPRCSND